MKRKSSSALLGSIIIITLLGLIIFSILKLIHIPVGNFIDWVIAIAAILWLMTIVVVPWNIHFEAKTVLNDAKNSEKLNINFDHTKLKYVSKVATYALIIAIAFHIISAGALYWISYAQISKVGYYGAGAAILLTFARPISRFYEYVSDKLTFLRNQIVYPREDVHELRGKVYDVEQQLKNLQLITNENDAQSIIYYLKTQLAATTNRINSLKQEVETFKTTNQAEHEKLTNETRNAVAQLTEDGKFIHNLVEIIRFIKKA